MSQLHEVNEIPKPVLDLVTKHVPEQSFESLEVRIWDFAGQDLYYTTHQVNLF